jgi:tRNA-specific 2-thiouridylase
VHRFTVGQRRNLGVAVGERAYVVSLNAADGSVTLGSDQQLSSRCALLGEFSLASDLALPLRADVAVRYRGKPHPAFVTQTAAGVRVVFDEPVRAVVVGQYCVLYADERVLGGGVITSADAELPSELGSAGQDAEQEWA